MRPCDEGIAIPQTKFNFFLVFKQSFWPISILFLALFGLLQNFSSCHPVPKNEALQRRVVGCVGHR